jgi:hemoglobin-like flavoprotein
MMRGQYRHLHDLMKYNSPLPGDDCYRMFEDYPDLIQLFPFGQDDMDHTTGRLKINARTRVHVRAHASAVMRVIGTAVAGKIGVEELVPRLRNVGATHKIVGVQNMHYDILYRHLVTVIREEVGPENWDQDTEDAWEQAFISITDLIKRPSKRLETEPLMGWGSVMMAACAYFTLVTPFRFAGFYIGHPRVILVLDVLDFAAAMVLLLDLMIDIVQTKFRVSRKRFIEAESESEDERNRKTQLRKSLIHQANSTGTFLEKFVSKHRKSLFKILRRYRMDRWVPWPSLDIRVLLSFVLQGLFVQSSLCTRLGLHWTQMFGLLRVTCASRVLHFVQCTENNLLLRQKMDADRQLTLRIVKLVIQLAFITHV